jgi:adenosylcobalamin-dependent ribonucleoside-triphosphate reductase
MSAADQPSPAGAFARPDFVRDLHPGMGQAVAERTVLRKVLTDEAQELLDPGLYKLNASDPHFREWATVLHNTPGYSIERDDTAVLRGFEPPSRWETWRDVADRVAAGNCSLHPTGADDLTDYRRHLRSASILMSGRHLQHGDMMQASRNLEVYSNCSTSAAGFLLFYLLLNGSGVGRAYDDDLMVVNWDNQPAVRCVLDDSHPDFDFSSDEGVRDARHKYGKGTSVHWFEVPDTREGWMQAIEKLEVMTFQKAYRDDLLVLDFSKVRARGEPIMGMQGRPSSGPRPMMNAIHKIATLKGAGLAPWLQAMYVDHYLAEPVLVGGARRAARMATKYWRDKDILDFIEIKRPIEYQGLSVEETIAKRERYAAEGRFAPMSFLWSSNNSVTVDEEFWRLVASDSNAKLARHAKVVFKRLCECAYGDGTGEPGIINVDLLVQKDKGQKNLSDGSFVGSERVELQDETRILLATIAKRAQKKRYKMITNPCGEISLSVWGGYCVIADVVPFHAASLEDAQDSFEHAARALIRVNTMDNVYGPETKRTNRIGVGMTGVHEFAWKFFQVGFKDLVRPDFAEYEEFYNTYEPHVTLMQVIRDASTVADAGVRSAAFWEFLGHCSRQTMRAAFAYADKMGVNRPHTVTTIKPAGTTSKLFGLSEGWHLPALAHYMRWVQFREDDPLVDQYEAAGYPVRRNLKTYRGHAIVGFPTEPTIAGLGMGDELVLAGDASPSDQYEWLRLGEFFWIEGGTVSDQIHHGEPRPGEERHGNQISYTLKYKPTETSFEAFQQTLLDQQSSVRCCSVMPQESGTGSYEYLPEEAVTKAEYEQAMHRIRQSMEEDIGREHVGCDTGACPVDFSSDK